MKPIGAACRFVFAALCMGGLAPSVGAQAASPAFTPPPPPQKQEPGVEKRLKVFDVLDFDVFSNQKWDRLGESHAKDIVVTWPDGHETHGIAPHIEDLKAMFVYAPDIQISKQWAKSRYPKITSNDQPSQDQRHLPLSGERAFTGSTRTHAA